MKKSLIITLVIILIPVTAIILYNIRSPIMEGIPTERAEVFDYNGRHYESEGYFAADDDMIFKGRSEIDGSSVYFLEDTDTPNYILIVGSDNSRHYLADGVSIDTSGEITKILIDPGIRATNNRVLTSKEDIEKVRILTAISGEEKKYFIKNYFTQGNSFYYEYNNCPVSVSENLGGYVALTEGEWIYVSPENYRKNRESKGNNSVIVTGVKITDSELIRWLKKSDLAKYIHDNKFE